MLGERPRHHGRDVVGGGVEDAWRGSRRAGRAAARPAPARPPGARPCGGSRAAPRRPSAGPRRSRRGCGPAPPPARSRPTTPPTRPAAYGGGADAGSFRWPRPTPSRERAACRRGGRSSGVSPLAGPPLAEGLGRVGGGVAAGGPARQRRGQGGDPAAARPSRRPARAGPLGARRTAAGRPSPTPPRPWRAPRRRAPADRGWRPRRARARSCTSSAGDVDLHRAGVEARPAQRRRVRQRGVVLARR